MNAFLSDVELGRLNAAMEHAFATGDESGLDVLGYGEITTVVRWPGAQRPVACKRLPPFGDPIGYEQYCHCFDTYILDLAQAGIKVIESAVQTIEKPDGIRIAFCIQPALPPEDLVTSILHEASSEQGERLLDSILDRIRTTVCQRTGLDGQLSNWMVDRDDLVYLDVTTPMVRQADGSELLDTDLFLAAAPGPIRGLLKRFILKDMLDKYHCPRGVVKDMIGNLYKERLTRWIPYLMEKANAWVSPPLTPDEIRNYYVWDARIWVLWQGLRRLHRFWNRRMLRRAYPFLLPGKIQRHV